MEEHKQELPEIERQSQTNSLDIKDEVTETVENQTKVFPIAGFWKRAIAIFIDLTILAIPLIILGFLFSNFAYSLGPWGRLIGFALGLTYWGYYGSERKNGQTIGKRLRKIAVVNKNGDFLSLRTSFFRAFILATINLFNGWALVIFENPIFLALQTIIVFGGIITIFYGLIFNRTTRQGIHDLIVGSYVVNVPVGETAPPPKLPAIHKNIMIGIIGFGAILGILGSAFQIYNTADRKPFSGISGELGNLQELHDKIAMQGDFFTVGVRHITRRSSGSSEILQDINIDVWSKEPCSRVTDNCNELVDQIAEIVLDEYSEIEELTGMQIAITNRFDLGLATGNSTIGAQLRIEDWRKRLGETSE